MAGSVNKVILVGNVGKDPEIRTTQNGGRIANLSIATSESWKDKTTGDRKENTQWHRVVVFNDALVGVAERFLKKGSKVYLEGQLETRKWVDKNGADQYATEVVLRPYRGELILLDKSEGGNRPPSADSPDDYGRSRTYQAPSHGGANFADDLDDEIPFAWASALLPLLLAVGGMA